LRNVDSSSEIHCRAACANHRLRRHGFTLLEVLLALAIIALLATVLIGGASALLSDQPVSVNDVFWKAVREARKTALKVEHDIRLKYDRDKKQFLLIDGVAPPIIGADGLPKEETPLKTFPVLIPPGTEVTVEFLGSSAKGGNAILVGGVLLESQPIPYVTFYSDGTCSAFRLQVMRNGAANILSIDQWTCAPILTPTEQNAF
jgi:prepilin-type N-terminal cleavage/methylation domain-containing protein